MNFENITYRKAVTNDIEYLLKLRKITMSEHLISSGMNPSEEQHLNRIKYNFENAKIIYFDNEKIGLLKIKEVNDEIEIIQIQIIPEFQNIGVGKYIINSIIEKSCNLKLSVLKQNKAKNLYLKMGFKIIKESENSYQMERINAFKTKGS